MPRQKVDKELQLIGNLTVKFQTRDLPKLEEAASKSGEKKVGTWARKVLLKAANRACVSA